MIIKLICVAAIGALNAAVSAFAAAAREVTDSLHEFAITFRDLVATVLAWAFQPSAALAFAAPIPALASVAYADPAPIRSYAIRRLQREKATPRHRMPGLLAA